MLEAAVDATSTVVPITEESGERNGYSNHNAVMMPPELEGAYREYGSKLFSVVYSILKDKEESQDIIQETWAKALKGYTKFRGDSKIETWLYRIARNLAVNRYHHFRRRAKTRTYSLDVPLEGEEGDFHSLETLVSFQHQKYHFTQAVEAKEIIEKAKVAIEELEEHHRKVLQLWIKGRNYEEIAEDLETEVGTVKSRLARARKAVIEKIFGDEAPRGKLDVFDKQRRY